METAGNACSPLCLSHSLFVDDFFSLAYCFYGPVGLCWDVRVFFPLYPYASDPGVLCALDVMNRMVADIDGVLPWRQRFFTAQQHTVHEDRGRRIALLNSMNVGSRPDVRGRKENGLNKVHC